MNEIEAPKKERTRILRILSDSIPQSVRFTASAAGGNSPASGLIEIERWSLFVPRRSESLPLAAENVLKKNMFDTAYSVFVTPNEDTKIIFQSRHFTSRRLFQTLALVLAAGIAAALVSAVLRASGS